MRGRKAEIYFDTKQIFISSQVCPKWEVNDGKHIGSRVIYGKAGTLKGKVVERWIREKDLEDWVVLKRKEGWSVE